ncbi:polysaccharide deacetylase family protein [Desulfomarina sp.]
MDSKQVIKNSRSQNVPVLMYHALEDPAHPARAKDPGEQLYVLKKDTFYCQMKYLSENGFEVFLLEDLLRLKKWPERAVVLTFDDGHQSNYTIALPILEYFGFKAHFFITTDWVNTPDFLNTTEILKLVEKGMKIGSHGTSHSYFNEMELNRAEKELAQSKKLLERCTNGSITSFSAPGGRINTDTVKLARRTGYSLLCTSQFALFELSQKSNPVPRIPVKAGMDMTVFKKIVHRDTRLIKRYKLKSFILWSLKNLLGNAIYEKLRTTLLSRK